MRSTKYAVMAIALTFLIFFMVEILNKRKIHPLQYILVGLALCLFYILLVSISEHSNFNLAYLISTISVVGMISLYSISVFKVKKDYRHSVGYISGDLRFSVCNPPTHRLCFANGQRRPLYYSGCHHVFHSQYQLV